MKTQPLLDGPHTPPPPGDGMLGIAITIAAAIFIAGLLSGFFIWGR